MELQERQNVWLQYTDRKEVLEAKIMEETQQLKNTPLPVATIIEEAFKFPFRQTSAFWVWLSTLCLVSFAIFQAEHYFIWPILRNLPLPINILVAVKTMLVGLGGGLYFTLLSMICYRIILLGEKPERWVEFYRWSHRETAFLIWVFLLYVVALMFNFIPVLTKLFLSSEFFGALIHLKLEWPITIIFIQFIYIFGIPLMVGFLLLYVLSRIILVLPATAIGGNPTLSWAWDRSRGNGWRLTFMSLLPIIIMSCFVGSSKNIVDVIPTFLFWIPESIGSVCFVFGAMLETVLLSETYKELKSQQQVSN